MRADTAMNIVQPPTTHTFTGNSISRGTHLLGVTVKTPSCAPLLCRMVKWAGTMEWLPHRITRSDDLPTTTGPKSIEGVSIDKYGNFPIPVICGSECKASVGVGFMLENENDVMHKCRLVAD